MRVMYRESQERMTQLVQAIVPDTERYQSPEAETASVYPTLEESREDNPNDSIIAQTRLNISPPEEYSGSSDLEVYETFIVGILQ